MYFFGSNCCNVIPFVSVVTFCCQWAEAQMTLLSVIKKCLSYLVYWKILFLLNTIIYDPVHHTFMCIYLNCAPLCLFMRMNYLYIKKKFICIYLHIYICTRIYVNVVFSFLTLTNLSCQNGGEFLIQANAQKGPKLQEDDNSTVFEHVEVGSLMI